MSMFIPTDSPSDQPNPDQQPEPTAPVAADSAPAEFPLELPPEFAAELAPEASLAAVAEAQVDDTEVADPEAEAEATSQVVAVMSASAQVATQVAEGADHIDAAVYSESSAAAAAGEATRGRGFPPFYAVSTRIEKLNRAIGLHPESPVNYILRGEAFLEEDQRDQAIDDFLAAVALAGQRETTWEYINRAMLDRARQGLRRCGYTA